MAPNWTVIAKAMISDYILKLRYADLQWESPVYLLYPGIVSLSVLSVHLFVPRDTGVLLSHISRFDHSEIARRPL